jgi:hypothetical protein
MKLAFYAVVGGLVPNLLVDIPTQKYFYGTLADAGQIHTINVVINIE